MDGARERVPAPAQDPLVGPGELDPLTAERLLELEEPVRRLAGERLPARPADVDPAEVQLRPTLARASCEGAPEDEAHRARIGGPEARRRRPSGRR